MSASPQKRLVIVGGGVVGVSTAFHLRRGQRPGERLDIVVVDRLGVAQAASGRAGGFLAKDWCGRGCSGTLARRSFQLYEQYAADGVIDAQAVEYRKLDTLMLGDISKGPGLPAWVDGDAASCCRVIGTTDTTAQVHPRKLTHAMHSWLLDAEPSQGSYQLLVDAVVGLRFADSGRATGVRLASGQLVDADDVALCMGPWLGAAAAWFSDGGDAARACRAVVGRRAHSLVYRLDAALQAQITPHALFGECDIYPRPGEVYACETNADDQPPPDDPADVAPSPAHLQRLARDCAATSSLLRGEPAEQSCCYLPASVDGEPVVGRLHRNVFVAGGHSCWGILMAPVTGLLMAAIVADRTDELDPELLAVLPKLQPTRFFRS